MRVRFRATCSGLQLGVGLFFVSVLLNGCGSVGGGSNAVGNPPPPPPVSPTIVTQPTSQTVTVGQTATFTVVASGTSPLNYQWSKNGVAIMGATSASYTTPATAISDSGSQYTVAVSNVAGNQTSKPATLTVNNPTPQASAISPTVVRTGYASSFTLTVTGQSFIPNSTIQVNGANRATTFVSATQLTTISRRATSRLPDSLRFRSSVPLPEAACRTLSISL